MTNGVFCLEGEWDDDLHDRTSVLPVLELLERLGQIKAIHRNVATRGELKHYLAKWVDGGYDDYWVLYLATHGDKGTLVWSAHEDTTLDHLADILGEGAKDAYVYLGSCRTLLDSAAAQDFVERTKVAALMGYRKDVDWIEGAALEVILLSSLANHGGRPTTLFKQLMKRHGGLAQLYDFTMVTKAGVLRGEDHKGS